MNGSRDASLPDPHYRSPGCIDTLNLPDISCNERINLVGDSGRKRKRHETNTDNQALCWDAFQPYIAKCIPVKINDVSRFRHVTEGTENEPVFCTVSADSLPSDVLDKSITVQCVPNNNHGSLQSTNLADGQVRQTTRSIDAKLSLIPNTDMGGQDLRTFMGQEDQVTTCMSFRELVTFDHHTHHVSASQLPILDVDEMEEDEISLSVDGKLNNHQDTANLELSPLAALLRLPSYLLLGNPRNEPKDIVIHNINLWHAPQSCCTNVHYDDHDNLLIVTNGVKVVELCPPGCIKASGVYSTHANHPELLRRHRHTQADEDILRDIQATLERKQGKTHIVTVTAGEALYIPLGWWHRVVSKCDQDIAADRGGNGCTAINVWFDYHHPSRQSDVPEHMTVFHLRQSSRKYFELNKDRATTILLQEKKRTFFIENREIKNDANAAAYQGWSELHAIVFDKEEIDKSSISAFGKCYHQCLSSLLRTKNEYRDQDRFHTLLEAFLLRIQLGNASHVASLVNMWTKVGPSEFFSDILRKLSPEACFILTQAWERHAGITTFIDENGETRDEAEISYQVFFSNLEMNGNDVRNHLLAGVEEFYRQAWVKLSSAV